MSNLRGQVRTPRAPVRERRNATNLSGDFVDLLAPPISVNGDGRIAINLGDGIGELNEDLVIDLVDTNPGLEFSSGQLKAKVQDVLSIDSNGIKLNYTTGLENDGSDNLQVTLEPFDTDNLSEGDANLYYTDERVDDRVADLIQDGTGIAWTYDDANGTLTGTVSLGPFDTDNLSEGTANVYFTNERAQDAVGTVLVDTASVDFTYDDATPQITATVLPAGVDHDSLANFVANEHVDHSGVNVTAGEGLTGGGDITASRQIDMDVNGLTEETGVDEDNDYFLMYDSSASAHRKVPGSNLLGNTAPDTINTPRLAPYRNLRVQNHQETTPAAQVGVSADELIVHNGNDTHRLTSVSATADITGSGAGGLDTGSEAASTWYHIWVVWGSTPGSAAMLSTSSTSPTMPSGYTHKGYVGAIRNDSSSDFFLLDQVNNAAVSEDRNVLNEVEQTTTTQLNISNRVPSTASEATMLVAVENVGTSTENRVARVFSMRTSGGTNLRQTIVASELTPGGRTWSSFNVPMPNRQTVWYNTDTDSAIAMFINGWVFH